MLCLMRVIVHLRGRSSLSMHQREIRWNCEDIRIYCYFSKNNLTESHPPKSPKVRWRNPVSNRLNWGTTDIKNGAYASPCMCIGERSSICNHSRTPGSYTKESQMETLKSAIKIRNTARLSCILTTMILMVWRVADRWQYDAGMQHDGAVVV